MRHVSCDALMLLFAEALAVVVVNPPAFCGDPAAGAKRVSFSVELDLGRDLGQSFGSIFEARDAAGRVVAGAGFQDVYNTRFRSDRHTLQFFVKPPIERDAHTFERLPHPDLGSGIYLFDLNARLYAWTSVRQNSVKAWEESMGRWNSALPAGVDALRSGDGAMRLGSEVLLFAGNTVRYGDRVLLSPPDVGGYYNFYYANGHLFFYHRVRDPSGSSTRIYACPWRPAASVAASKPIDVDRAVIMKAKYDLETPFAWGQFEDQVLTVSNTGGIYVYEDSSWRTLLEADDQVSYQVYSMLHWHDRLLLAQYPTGNIFEYQGVDVKRIEGWPPCPPEVSSSARECQTLAIYRGELFAGVWPWAELWRYDRDARQWHSMGRMFSHPELTDRQVHPYEAEAKRSGLVLNHWGQRVSSMVPLHDGLVISTSSKGTSEWRDSYDFLTPAQRRDYGAAVRLRMPGNLTAQIAWRERPVRLEFRVDATSLSIRQDDEVLARRDAASVLGSPSRWRITWGEGVFGPLQGKTLQRRWNVE